MKKPVNRHAPTPEEKAEAARLKSAWEAFKAENSGASQLWLGEATGIGGQSVISQYLRGDLALNFANLVKFCSVLRVDPATISPRLVSAHVSDPAQNDLFVTQSGTFTAIASKHAGSRHDNSMKRGQNLPLSPEASELIQCVARLDGHSQSVKQSFKLVTGLLLLAAASTETQDVRTAEELVKEAEHAAEEILAATTDTRREDATHHRKSR
ncbi:helix-turn-helix transcriptional regulator [Burkholderia pseudomallei]|uniref:helix-turn-helix transcriptional regulator n=1 Tax=Burkholderia pseudomallei TaxID=28450 RepID=UPI0005E81CB6|nr:helix-turn-helix transcriptional regulator [Burkholderia pseudomallei]CFL83502.1 Cro/CI family transcriptional regulator [Burkholderia pseudomallei]CRY22800.1 Cro/CI family transcriptional regulator [Burkholderia pseudomallei]